MTRVAPIVALLLATVAGAEVRVGNGPKGPFVDVHVSRFGVWSPEASNSQRRGEVLNVRGDRAGDGYPAFGLAAEGLLVAWARPSTNGLAVASREGTGPVRQWELANAGTVGHPSVLRCGDGWLIVWSSASSGDVQAVGLDPETGFGSIESLGEGALVATSSDGQAASLAIQAGSSLSAYRIVLVEPVPIPIPIPILRIALPGAIADGGAVTRACEANGRTIVSWGEPRNATGFVVLQGGEATGPWVQRGSGNSCATLLSSIED